MGSQGLQLGGEYETAHVSNLNSHPFRSGVERDILDDYRLGRSRQPAPTSSDYYNHDPADHYHDNKTYYNHDYASHYYDNDASPSDHDHNSSTHHDDHLPAAEPFRRSL